MERNAEVPLRIPAKQYGNHRISTLKHSLAENLEGGQGTFIQKLMHGVRDKTERRETRPIQKMEDSKGVQLEGTVEGWMERSLVGRLKSPDFVEGVQDSFVLAGMHSVRVCHLGGLLVLLTGDEGVNLMNLVKDSGEGWKEIFNELKLWSPTTCPEFRLLWLKCDGLPLQF